MKTVRFRNTQIDFQEICVHCLGWADKTYPFERTFFFGRRSAQVQIPAPLCFEHLKCANKKSAAQIWCDRAGLVIGVMIGLAVCAGLLLHWSATEQNVSVLSIPLAIFAGFSIGFTLWTFVHFWLTPRFASAETKTVINSLQITKYDPFRQILELTFSNDTVAELIRRGNLDILAEELADLKRFQISAHITSHDIRLKAKIKTVAPLDHAPTLGEAKTLLEPAIEWVMARNLGKDCFYDIDSIEIQELSSTEAMST